MICLRCFNYDKIVSCYFLYFFYCWYWWDCLDCKLSLIVEIVKTFVFVWIFQIIRIAENVEPIEIVVIVETIRTIEILCVSQTVNHWQPVLLKILAHLKLHISRFILSWPSEFGQFFGLLQFVTQFTHVSRYHGT